MTSPGPSILVIGFGNTLRRDDGLGVRAAEQLRGRVPADRVEVMTCHQLTVELCEPVSRAELVILIDAREGGIPGTLHVEEILPQSAVPDPSSHYVEPGALLAYAAALYGCAPRTLLLTVVGESFEFGETLSAPVQQALPELVRKAEQLCTISSPC
jgi:hydrogenase maturation protease